MKTKRKRYVILALIMIIFVSVACYRIYFKTDSRIQSFQKEFDLTLPKGTQVIHSENDYGALGDGFCLYIYQLSSQEMDALLKNRSLSRWRPLPFDKSLAALIDERVEAFSSSGTAKQIDFNLQSGYYIFRNSGNSQAALSSSTSLDTPYPNVIFGIIDPQTNRIYYGTWDM